MAYPESRELGKVSYFATFACASLMYDGTGQLFHRIFQLHVRASPHSGSGLKDTMFLDEKLMEKEWPWGLRVPETFAPNGFELWSLCQVNSISLTKYAHALIHLRVLLCPTRLFILQDDRRTM